MSFKSATLVYQAGIANVFAHTAEKTPRRLIQSDFHTCECFSRGLQAAGIEVKSAWCNQAGDIANNTWQYENLDEAPFFDSMRPI